jgi:hypothetical protein
MGKGYVEAAAKDREMVNELEVALKDFKAKPQAFNGRNACVVERRIG